MMAMTSGESAEKNEGAGRKAGGGLGFYLLVVGMVLLTTCTGQYMARRLMALHDGAVRENVVWTGRLLSYGQLAHLSWSVSAAGTVLSEAGAAPDDEGAERMAAMMNRLERGLADARADLAAEAARHKSPGRDPAIPDLLRRVDELVEAQHRVNRHIAAIGAAAHGGRREEARRQAAIMHRELSGFLQALETLGWEVHRILLKRQQAQQERARAEEVYEVLIAALVLLMGVCVALYGVRQLRDGRRRLREREQHFRALERRNQDMRRVLDNVNQGLLTLERDGSVARERSAIVDRWLGAPAPGQPFAQYLGALDPQAGALFALGWEAILDDALPLELCLEQLPRSLAVGGRFLQLDYRPIWNDAGGRPEIGQVLLMISDVTAHRERERIEAEQREILVVLERIMNNKDGFLDFFSDASEMVRRLTEPRAPLSLSEEKRLLHTLKGNAGIFGLSTIAGLCHQIEGRMRDSGGPMTARDRGDLCGRWREAAIKLAHFVEQGGAHKIEIEDSEYTAIIRAIASGEPRRQILAMIASWKLQPTQTRLDLLSDQVRVLGRQLGKGEVTVRADGGGLRLEPERWAPFWSALLHVARNAVDHGLEVRAERVALGKPAAGTVVLRTLLKDDCFAVEVSDDGRGIAWERLQARAQALGLPSRTREDLVEALFADGVSTREETTEVSGRGVGMGAVREAAERLGGRVQVESEPGRGATFRFLFPAAAMAAAAGPEVGTILRYARPA